MMAPDERPPHSGASDGRKDAAVHSSGTPRRGLSRPMRITLWTVGAIVAAGIVLALAFLIAQPPAGQGSDATPSADASAARGPDPEGTPVAGSEVQAPDPSATASDRLPPREGSGPLVTPPLPPSASAEGSLVDGYPRDIMGPAADSDVISSSIATEGDTMQVTLVARTDQPEDQVRSHFLSVWTSLGLVQTAQDRGTSLAVTDGTNSMSLAFASSGTGTVYMVYGVFRAG